MYYKIHLTKRKIENTSGKKYKYWLNELSQSHFKMNSTWKGYVNGSHFPISHNTGDDKVTKDYIMIIRFILELLFAFGIITAHKEYVRNRGNGDTVIHEEEEEEEEEEADNQKRIYTVNI